MDEGASRRRRGAGLVTPTACTECRKKRAKCDGQTPCGRCAAQQGVECIYEAHVRQSKENMRNEIEQLRKFQRQSEQVLAALVGTETSATVLQQLRFGQTLEMIADGLHKIATESPEMTTFRRASDQQAIGGALQLARSIEGSPLSTVAYSENLQSPYLRDGPAYQSSAFRGDSSEYDSSVRDRSDDRERRDSKQSDRSQGIRHPLIAQNDSHSRPRSPVVEPRNERVHGQGVLLGTKEIPPRVEQWTTVSSNETFINHIMALYFCWEYPTFASLSKDHFLDDYRSGTSRFSNHAEARSDPDDPNTAGDHFFAEAYRLLELEKERHILTTIQALGLMSLREASCGRSSESLFFSGQSVRLAIELGLHQDMQVDMSKQAEIDHEVRSATFWGAFSLDQAWSLGTGRLSQFSRDLKLAKKPTINQQVEASAWIPYTDDGAPMDRPCTQPSNVRSVFQSFCELSEIIHKSLYTLYTPGREVTGKGLLAVYTDYLHWYENLTPVLRLGHNFTPAVLFAHMLYHFAILLLFRPFIRLNIISSSVSPRDVCAQASDAISALVNSYNQLYGLRRTPSFVPYFVLSSCITHLVTYSSSRAGPEKIRQGLNDLKEMTKCHAISSRALDILKYLVTHWEIHGLDDDEDAELRDIKSMCRPRSSSLNQFCPHIEVQDVSNSLRSDHPLFFAFPLQGRPLLDITRLEHCGFAVSEEWLAEQAQVVTGDTKMELS